MEISQIRAFLAVAEELHFGKAADRLGIAQPPLSRTIRQLEKDLGATLFRRTTRSVELSAAGLAFVEPARAVLQTCESAQTSVKLATDGELGTVNIGFAGASSHRLIARLAQASKARRPGITLELESATFAAEALARILDGTLDIALLRWQSKPPRLTGRVVMVERPVVIMDAEHRLAGRTTVRMDDLRDEDFVSLPAARGSNMRDMMLHWAFEAGFTPRIVQEAPDTFMVGALVAAGMGVAITYDSVLTSLPDPNLVTVPLAVDHDPIAVYLAHREDDDNPAVREVLATAEAVLPTVDLPHRGPTRS